METAQYEFNQNPPVAIPNIIIKKNKILNKDILATKCKSLIKRNDFNKSR